jgi:hypothetical protein
VRLFAPRSGLRPAGGAAVAASVQRGNPGQHSADIGPVARRPAAWQAAPRGRAGRGERVKCATLRGPDARD